MKLACKVAIVTGGGSGIGEAISHKFAQGGASVFIADLPDSAAKVDTFAGTSHSAFLQ